MWSGITKSKKDKGAVFNDRKAKVNCVSVESLLKNLQDDERLDKKRCNKMLWYHGDIRCRNEAETKLKTCDLQKDGIFLVRNSIACSDDFVLSFTCKGKFVHFQIKCHPHLGTYSLSINAIHKLQNIQDGLDKLIEFYHENCIIGTCKLTEACPDGCPPPTLSMSVGTTNSLHRAIDSRNKELSIQILDHPLCPRVDARNSDGFTALHLASQNGELDVVKRLLSRRATTDALDKCGFTPLHHACLNNHDKVVHHLIAEGRANPQRRIHPTGNVALHLATEMGHVNVVKALLKLDVPCFPRNYDKITPYELALRNSFGECLKLLDNYQAPPASTKCADWFHSNITGRKESTEILNKYFSQNGYFLVRKSASDQNKVVLDVCFNKKQEHFVIETCMSAVFIAGGPLLPSLEHLIEYYSTYSDGLPETLSVAVSPSGGLVPMMRYNKYIGDNISTSASEKKSSILPKATEPLVLDKKTLEIGTELGHGEFASVLKGKWKAPNFETVAVAIKTLHEQHMASNRDGFLSEAKIMVNLAHPCIVKLIGICQGPPLMLVQELLPLGSLQDYLLDYPEKVSIDFDVPLWAEQIANGMEYLEREKFVHRDLATRNILLASKKIAKISDFGLSRAVGASDYYRASQGGKWPVKWYAPESINYGTFSSASDVWSFGVTVWEMYSLGEQPYDDMNGAQVIEFIEHKGRLSPPKCSPTFMNDLMSKCWRYHEDDRPNFKTIHEELHSFKI